MNKITNPSLKKKLSSEGFYTYYDITDGSYSESKVRSLIEQFPALERMACYVFDPKTGQSEGQMDRIENIIKTYCPEYTYDELEYDHDLTGYVNDNESLPFFKLGLEYTLSEEGLEVRIPANGIRFDESTFQLTSLSILPWMGAGSSVYNGYTFIPDGSGTIIRFEDITTGYNISGEMYRTRLLVSRDNRSARRDNEISRIRRCQRNMGRTHRRLHSDNHRGRHNG